MVTNFKEVGETLISLIYGDVQYNDEQLENFDNESYPIIKDTSRDLIMGKMRKIMDINILDKKVNFSVFEKLPKCWKILYTMCIDTIASENGQAVMA